MNSAAEIKNVSTEVLSSLKGNTPLRKDAREVFEKLGLPLSKNEEYRFAPITRALEKNFSSMLSDNPLSNFTDIQSVSITALDSFSIVFVNGVFNKSLSKLEGSNILIEALQEDKHQKSLATVSDYKGDALVAWNTAAWNNGVYIEVPANTIVQKPVVFYHIHDTSQGDIKTITRNLFIIGKSSEVTVVEKYDSIGSNNSFSNQVTEAIVSENAGLNLFSIQADHGNRYQFNQTSVWQANHSRVNTYTITLDGKFVRNNLHLMLDGEGCESHMYGLYLLHSDTLADNHTVVDHKKPNSFSNELYKGVLDGNSKGVFNGKIFVRPQAQKTNAFQSNRNILLSDKATINTKPQLEIWADDVKCSHGCTTGQLDDEALFYLRSRGIDKDTSRAMMLYAFAGEVIETITNKSLKKFIDALVSERLHKNF